ncbi:hypothetical protein SLS62_003965 [Diatrype stigma]|uniref:Calcineurin-like phosphoesterase domain-containing protein n=1 Tax=Diatrype stigma TaxID=117547 RepID=A0AAN9URP8_9PEZI
MAIQTRFLIISDTHSEDNPSSRQQSADVAIHCGDLTEESKIKEFRVTLELLKNIQAPLKLVIAGNHDFTLDLPTFKGNIENSPDALDPELVQREFGHYGEVQQLFEDAKVHGIHLLHEGTHQFELDNGALLTVYASPYTPSHESWGFSYRPQQHDFLIPASADVVVTHGPPHGIMDTNAAGKRAGCPNLFAAVARAQPKLHCFGHMHEGWGAKLVTWRPELSAAPSHFSDIDNEHSSVIAKLPQLKSTKFDSAEIVEEKRQRRRDIFENQQGCVATSHCAGDESPLQRGQTLFVNAAVQGTTEELPLHPAWLVDIELPANIPINMHE